MLTITDACKTSRRDKTMRTMPVNVDDRMQIKGVKVTVTTAQLAEALGTWDTRNKKTIPIVINTITSSIR